MIDLLLDISNSFTFVIEAVYQHPINPRPAAVTTPACEQNIHGSPWLIVSKHAG